MEENLVYYHSIYLAIRLILRTAQFFTLLKNDLNYIILKL